MAARGTRRLAPVIRVLAHVLVREIAADHGRGGGAVADVEYPGEVGTIRSVRIPIKFDGQWCPARPAPALGQDNAILDRYKES